MARVRPSAVLLLAAICGIRGSAETCQYRGGPQLWGCAIEAMDAERNKLVARINMILLDFPSSGRNVNGSVAFLYFYTGINVENLANIRPTGVKGRTEEGYSGRQTFLRCSWTPAFTVAMNATFGLCKTDSSGNENCDTIDAHPNITKTSTQFEKPWRKGNNGSQTTLWNEADINLNLVKPANYKYFSDFEMEAFATSDVRRVSGELRSLLAGALDGWLDNDISPRVLPAKLGIF